MLPATYVESGGLLLDVGDEDSVAGGFMLALDDHDAQALLPFVNLQLTFRLKAVEFLALEYL